MPKLLLGFFTGLTVSSIAFITVVLPWYGQEKMKFGAYQASVTVKSDFARKVREQLGSDFSQNEKSEFFMDAKDTAIFVVERNGVKTLRMTN